jgi:hypothetical protein
MSCIPSVDRKLNNKMFKNSYAVFEETGNTWNAGLVMSVV